MISKNKTKRKLILASLILCLGIIIAPLAVSAVYTYTPMEEIPGFGSVSSFPAYILAIYKFGIWTVGIAAMLMIIIGGFMYMTAAGNTSKTGTAKTIITDAIYGLVVALAAYLLLFIINPDLVGVNISMAPVTTPPPTTGPTKPPPSTPPGSPAPAGTCQGLNAQSGISYQCKDVSPELSSLLNCIKKEQPNAVITSVSDSAGLQKCQTSYSRPPCAHAQNSCHYGGSNCRNNGYSYAVDLSTRNLSAAQLMQAGTACGANYMKDESGSANHVHMSMGGSCGCN